MATIYSPTSENLKRVATLLENGQVVGVPTETVYGLGGLLFEESALDKIFSVKGRPKSDPLIVHVELQTSTLAALNKMNLIDTHALSDLAVRTTDQLIRKFWPGPLTLVLPKAEDVPYSATAGTETVALRAPKHDVLRALLQLLQQPLCAPSANRFGRISPTSALDVEEELGGKISAILDGGVCEIGLESTIIRIHENGDLEELRPGKISASEIEGVVSSKFRTFSRKTIASPGSLPDHYAPKTQAFYVPFGILEKMAIPGWVEKLPEKLGYIAFGGAKDSVLKMATGLFERKIEVATLSTQSGIEEAAHNFYMTLRKIDHLDIEMILIELPPETSNSLALALADRIRRAAKEISFFEPKKIQA